MRVNFYLRTVENAYYAENNGCTCYTCVSDSPQTGSDDFLFELIGVIVGEFEKNNWGEPLLRVDYEQIPPIPPGFEFELDYIKRTGLLPIEPSEYSTADMKELLILLGAFDPIPWDGEDWDFDCV
jgi:hypothetical protein